MHGDGHAGYDQDVQKVFIVSDYREPSLHILLVNDTHITGSLGNLPHDNKISHQLNGNIIHHQGKKCLIGIPLGFKESRNSGPYCPCSHGCHKHNHYKKWLGEGFHVDHTGCSHQGSDQYLSFSSQIPELHPECGSECQGYTEQDGNFLTQDPYLTLGTKSPFKHSSVYTYRVQACCDGSDDRTDYQGQDNRQNSYSPGLVPLHMFSFCNMKKRFFTLFCCFIITAHLRLLLPVWSSSFRSVSCQQWDHLRYHLPFRRKVPGSCHKVQEEHPGPPLHISPQPRSFSAG